MKKVLKLVLLCSLLLFSFSVSAQSLEEYLSAESARIAQAQTTETSIRNFITDTIASYNLSQATLDSITTGLNSEGVVLQPLIDSIKARRKRYNLRQVYFNQHPANANYYRPVAPSQTLMQTCINGDFAGGGQNYLFNSFANNANAMNGCNTPLTFNNPVIAVTNDFVNAEVSIISNQAPGFVQFDPTLAGAGVNVPTISPNGGNSSIKLNDNTADRSVTTMSRQLVINNPLLEYEFSFITENPNHDPLTNGETQNPFFKVSITTVGGQRTTLRCITGSPDCIFTETTNHAYLFSRWQCDQIDVSSYIGQQVTIEFTIADCYQGGHSATVYIDNICNFACGNAALGLLQINPLSADCTSLLNNNPYQITGSFTPPPNSVLANITITVSQNGGAFQQLNNPIEEVSSHRMRQHCQLQLALLHIANSVICKRKFPFGLKE